MIGFCVYVDTLAPFIVTAQMCGCVGGVYEVRDEVCDLRKFLLPAIDPS